MRIYNCHTHIFPDSIARDGYMTLRLARRGLDAATALDTLGERYADVMQVMEMGEEESLTLLRSAYPDATSFVVVSMDLDYAHVGNSDRPFKDQLDELARLREVYGEVVLPFIAADPRRPGLLELVQGCIEGRDFTGISISPALGFFPFDRRLMPVYEYANERQIPIIANCSFCPVKPADDIWDDLIDNESFAFQQEPDGPQWEQQWRATVVPEQSGHPVHYEYPLAVYPKLKICLTQAGGPDEWDLYPASNDHWGMRNWSSIVISMVRRHRRVYADVASVRSARSLDRLSDLLQEPEVRAKIVYGSNYHTVSLDGDEREFLMDMVRRLGKEDFRRIAFANPRKFLSSRVHPLKVSGA